VDLDEADLDTGADLENVDLGDFGDLDADDAGLQAALTVLAVLADDISDVAEDADDLAGDDVNGPDVPDLPDEPEPDQPSAEADAGAGGPGAAGALVVRPSPDGVGEDEEIFIFGDDDDDLPAAQVAVAGATADPVKDYLKQIGKVRLLNAEERSSWPSGSKPACSPRRSSPTAAAAWPPAGGSTWSGSPRTGDAPRTTCWRRTCGWWCRWPSDTPGGGCCSWT
jgi:RNA polymerase primary sigma factor